MKNAVCVYPEYAEALAAGAPPDAGLELQSFGLRGIRSKNEWDSIAGFYREFVGRHPERTFHLHGPFLSMTWSTPDWLILEAVEERLRQTLEVCWELRPKHLVMHLNAPFSAWTAAGVEAWVDSSAAVLRPWLDAFAAHDVRLVLENLFESDPLPAEALVDAMNHPFLGICLDVGHAHAYSKLDPAAWVRRLGRRIAHLHIHDNKGDHDAHMLPGQGSIDFAALYGAIRAECPEAVVSVEVDGPAHSTLEALSFSAGLCGAGPEEPPT